MAELKHDEEQAFVKWQEQQFSKRFFHDVGREVLSKEQHDFLHGGEWLTHVEKDHSLAHGFQLLATKHRDPIAKSWFGMFAHPQTHQTPKVTPELDDTKKFQK